MSQYLPLLGLLVPSLLTANLAFGPERSLPHIEYATPVGVQSPEAVLSDGDDFLVFWMDRSNITPGLHVAPVRSDGTVAPAPQRAVRLAEVTPVSGCWAGSDYLVVWNDLGDQTAVVATFSRDGMMTDSPRPLGTAVRVDQGALACAGGLALAALMPKSAGPVTAAILGERGGVLHSAAVAEADSAKVATDGKSFLLVLAKATTRALSPTPPPGSNRTTYSVMRIDASGNLLDEAPLPIVTADAPAAFEIAYGAGRYVLAVTQPGVVRRIVINPETLQTTELEPHHSIGLFHAKVLWNGHEFIAYWISNDRGKSEFVTLRFTADSSEPVSAFPVSGPVAGDHVHLAWNGRSYLAVWKDGSADSILAGGGDVAAVLLNATASDPVTSRFPISIAAAQQIQPALASAERLSLLAWHERSEDGSYHLLASRLRPDGRAVDLTPLVIAHGAGSSRPVVIFTGLKFLVVWLNLHAGSIHARAVALDGSLGEVVHVADGGHPAAASDADGVTLIAFSTNSGVKVIRFAADEDRVIGPPVDVSREPWPYSLSMASDGRAFLVTYTVGSDYWQFPSPNLRDVLGVRIASSGQPIDSQPIAIAATAANESTPLVASNGTGYLVVYYDSAVAAPDAGLVTRRISPEGTLGPPRIVGGRDLGFSAVDLAAGGQGGYVLVWQRFDDTSYGVTNVRVATLSGEGDLLDTSEPLAQEVMFGTRFSMRPAVTAVPGGVMVVYVRRGSGPLYGEAERLFVRSTVQPPARQRSAGR